MTLTDTPRHATQQDDQRSPSEKVEQVAVEAELAVGGALRAAEVATAVFIGLLFCPPLMILAVVVVAPLLAGALVLGLIAAVLSLPYLLIHRLRGQHGHASLAAHRLRGVGRGLRDLAPHRIVADARKGRSGR
jgi:hypothetical protein